MFKIVQNWLDICRYFLFFQKQQHHCPPFHSLCPFSIQLLIFTSYVQNTNLVSWHVTFSPSTHFFNIYPFYKHLFYAVCYHLFPLDNKLLLTKVLKRWFDLLQCVKSFSLFSLFSQYTLYSNKINIVPPFVLPTTWAQIEMKQRSCATIVLSNLRVTSSSWNTLHVALSAC